MISLKPWQATGTPKIPSRKELAAKQKLENKALREEASLARRWEHVLTKGYQLMSDYLAKGQPPELVCRGTGKHQKVMLRLEVDPDKGPEVLIFTADGRHNIGYWYAPGHQYNPLSGDRPATITWINKENG